MKIDEYRNQIVCGDCLEIMVDIPDNSVDLVVTSPPYNKNGFRGKRDASKGKGRWSGADIDYGDYKDDLDESLYKQWQIDILNECYRVVKQNGSIFYNHKIRRANHIASHPMEWICKTKLNLYQQIVWDRTSCCDHNIGYLDPTTELIFWLVKGKPICNKIKDFATEIWRFPAQPNTLHPAPFPIKLAGLCVAMTTDKDSISLDPFSGSGTLAVACKELGRDFIGIEISQKYVDIARQRLNNTTPSLF